MINNKTRLALAGRPKKSDAKGQKVGKSDEDRTKNTRMDKKSNLVALRQRLQNPPTENTFPEPPPLPLPDHPKPKI